MLNQNQRGSVLSAARLLCPTVLVVLGTLAPSGCYGPPDVVGEYWTFYTVVPTAPGKTLEWLVLQVDRPELSHEFYKGGAFQSVDFVGLPGDTIMATAGSAETGTVYQGVFQTNLAGSVRVDLPLTEMAPLTWQKRGANEYASWATQWQAADADNLAKTLSAHLLSLTSSEEEGWVRRTFLSADRPEQASAALMLGLQGSEPASGKSPSDTTWRWSSGEPVAYTNWATGEPKRFSNTDPSSNSVSTVYAYLWSDGGWHTTNSPNERYFVLERPAASP